MERLHRSGLTAADMWCLDSERRNTDASPGISFRLLQVLALAVHSPLCCQDRAILDTTLMSCVTGAICVHWVSRQLSVAAGECSNWKRQPYSPIAFTAL